jgi:putative endonuclease
MDKIAYVYIMASTFKRLYIGVTTELEIRVAKHKNHTYADSFTARYNIDKLVYFERFSLITSAIARETQLKGWLRQRKIALIVASNPDWHDLSETWGKPMKPYGPENEARVPEKYKTKFSLKPPNQP